MFIYCDQMVDLNEMASEALDRHLFDWPEWV